MNSKSRISSILNGKILDAATTGIPAFNLSELQIENDLTFELPTHLRLGHLAEKVVSHCIQLSTNYRLLYENTQIIQNKETLGELDFIIEQIETEKCFHLELAYKFYLFDPSISESPILNWIGPNRNDTLADKLEKLKTKQFPLLHHQASQNTFKDFDLEGISQKLCFMVSLFLPFKHPVSFNNSFQNAIVGYYLDYSTFFAQDDISKSYFIPSKKEWGIDPAQNQDWHSISEIKRTLKNSLAEQQSLLIWQKQHDAASSLFIVWW